MDYLIVFFRIITILPLLFVMTLLMGKRQVGELPVIDFIIAITLGSVVGADIADPSIHHGPTVLAVVVIALFQYVVSRANIKKRLFNHWLTLEPTIIISNGQLLRSHLERIRFPLDTVLEMLRQKGIFNLNEVEFAIVEPNGKLSVLKKNPVQPALRQGPEDCHRLCRYPHPVDCGRKNISSRPAVYRTGSCRSAPSAGAVRRWE
jgi:uncharacterized membrane protein YcaP (DUF421 family)